MIYCFPAKVSPIPLRPLLERHANNVAAYEEQLVCPGVNKSRRMNKVSVEYAHCVDETPRDILQRNPGYCEEIQGEEGFQGTDC
jgi:hypothetical protein